MKNIVLAITAFFFAFAATTASALDLGNGFVLDNEVVMDYEFTTETLVFEYTANVNYEFADGYTVYAETVVDLQNPAFQGAEFGVTAVINTNFNVTAYTGVNSDFEDMTFGVEAVLTF